MTAPSPVRSYTGPEIAELSEPHPTWFACPWVAQGAVTEVSGKIKLAGKTTFIAHMSDAIIHGDPFLGRPTRETPVLYVTEQSPGTFRHSLRGTRLLETDRFRAMFLAHFRAGKLSGWMDMLLRAGQEAATHGARVLVIDTLMQLAGVRDENDPGEAIRVMEPVQELAAAGFALVCVRHDRKSGGPVGDSSRGSSAYAGAMDILLQLTRQEGAATPIRRIDAVSRYAETPPELTIELTESGYAARGPQTPDDAQPRNERGRTSLLFLLSNEAMTVDEVVGHTDHPRATVARWLNELAAAGRVHREGTGQRGDPHRFRFISSHPPPRDGVG